MKFLKIKEQDAADLDITSFMNLMIVLVPVLLLNMTFSALKVIDLTLPELSDRIQQTPVEEQVVQFLVTPEKLKLEFPAGVALHEFDLVESEFDQVRVRYYLKQVKATFQSEGTAKKDITLLLDPKASYKTLISLMDTVRFYPEVVATSVVRAELFPDVSLGDYDKSHYSVTLNEKSEQLSPETKALSGLSKSSSVSSLKIALSESGAAS